MQNQLKKIHHSVRVWIAAALSCGIIFDPFSPPNNNPKKENPPLLNIRDYSLTTPFLSLSHHAPDITIHRDTSVFRWPDMLRQKKVTRDTTYIAIEANHTPFSSHTIAITPKNLDKLIHAAKSFQHRLGIKGEHNLKFGLVKGKNFYGINYANYKKSTVVLDSDYLAKASEQEALFVLGHEDGHIADFKKRKDFSPHTREYRADSIATVLCGVKGGEQFLERLIKRDDKFINSIVFKNSPVTFFMSPALRSGFMKEKRKHSSHPSSYDRLEYIQRVANNTPQNWLMR